jgi:hypothetical protein
MLLPPRKGSLHILPHSGCRPINAGQPLDINGLYHQVRETEHLNDNLTRLFDPTPRTIVIRDINIDLGNLRVESG